MRLSFKLALSVAFFAALLTPSARAEDDAVYLTTYVEVLPFEAPSAQSKATVTLEHYREASRKQAGDLRFDVLTELGRPDRLVILEAWRDAASFDAHDKADSTVRYRQAIDTMQSVPPDIRNNVALFLDARPRDNRPGAIYVVTHIDVTGDHKDDGVALLRSMSADTIKDAGNLHYDVFQQKNRPNHFTVVEAWANRKAQVDHAGAAHTRTFRQKLLPMAGALYDERLYVIVP